MKISTTMAIYIVARYIKEQFENFAPEVRVPDVVVMWNSAGN